MILFPCVLILYSRKKLKSKNIEAGKINKSIFDKNSFVYGICSFSVLIIGLIIYGFFHANTKKCVAESD